MKFWSNEEIPGGDEQIPEKRLLAAVLQRAITDYVSGEGDLSLNAGHWILSDEPTDAPLTFRFICEALDLEIDGLRIAIHEQAEVAHQAILSEKTAAVM